MKLKKKTFDTTAAKLCVTPFFITRKFYVKSKPSNLNFLAYQEDSNVLKILH